MVIGASVTNMQWVAQVQGLLREGEELEHLALAKGVGFDLTLLALTPLRVIGLHRVAEGGLAPVLEIPLGELAAVETGARGTLALRTADGARVAATVYGRHDLAEMTGILDRLRAGTASVQLRTAYDEAADLVVEGETAEARAARLAELRARHVVVTPRDPEAFAAATANAAVAEMQAWLAGGLVVAVVGFICVYLALHDGSLPGLVLSWALVAGGLLGAMVGVVAMGTQIGLRASRTTRRL